MFPTQAFRSATQRKILRVLAEQNKKYTVEELSEMCYRSEASISRALENSERFPFLERGRVKGSKKATYRLNPKSEYSEPIRSFFRLERRRERKNGTVPVEVWNLLEDISTGLENKFDGFIELFLFGSYATGNYYAGSDIDLLLLHTGEGSVSRAREILSGFDSGEKIQLVDLKIEDADSRDLEDLVFSRSPIRDRDTAIPLAGEVEM